MVLTELDVECVELGTYIVDSELDAKERSLELGVVPADDIVGLPGVSVGSTIS